MTLSVECCYQNVGIAILVIVSAVFSSNGSDEDSGTDGDSERFNPWKQDWTVYVCVALPCVGGLVLANIVS